MSQIQSSLELILSRKIFTAASPFTHQIEFFNSSGELAKLEILWQITTAMPRQLTAKNHHLEKLVILISWSLTYWIVVFLTLEDNLS